MWQVDLTGKLINVYTCLSLVLLARLIFFHRWFYPPALTHLAPSPTRICVFPTLKLFLLFQSRDPIIKKNLEIPSPRKQRSQPNTRRFGAFTASIMVTTLTLHMRCLSTVAPMARLNASGSEPRDDQEEKVAAVTSPLTPRPSTWWLGSAGATMRTARRGSHAQAGYLRGVCGWQQLPISIHYPAIRQ